jgi:uncharacterized protein YqeY
MTTQPSSLERTLRAALVPAMRAKDTVAVAALRSALAAIANAEAVDPSVAPVEVRTAASSEHVAAALVGLGAGEVARRQLSDDDVRRIVVDEVTSRETDAGTLERHGATERAGTLRAEAAVLSAVLRHVPVEPGSGT